MNEIRLRLRMAWAVLRGRSVMYRMRLVDGEPSVMREPAFIVENVMTRTSPIAQDWPNGVIIPRHPHHPWPSR